MNKFVLNNNEYIIREFNVEKDSIAELTSLLHRAYKRLADMGLRFIATFQDEEFTRNHLKMGVCYVLTFNGKMIGTIFYYTKKISHGPEIYQQDDVVLFGKFAVDPDYQKTGLGNILMEFIEDLARNKGKGKIILDTSEKALHLIDYYEKRGYEYVQHWQWSDVNYMSVVMAKKLQL